MGSKSVEISFGDVKLSGRITAQTKIGDTLALIKISPIFAWYVTNKHRYSLHAAEETPRTYNVMHVCEDGHCEFFSLPDDAVVAFFPDYSDIG